MIFSSMGVVDAFYENSKPFFKYLRNQGLDNLVKETGLRLRKKYSIVPHVRCFHVLFIRRQLSYPPQRILAPFGGPPTALPKFSDDDTWYYYVSPRHFFCAITWNGS